MKYTTLVLTFLAYVAIHILRMSYSSVKSNFEEAYRLDNIFLGLFDGLVYMSLGFGFFFRFLIEGNSKKTTIYLVFGIITALSFAVIPTLSFILSEQNEINAKGKAIMTIGEQPFSIQYLIPGISLIFFGFCQFTAWPVLLYLVSQHFNVQKEGTILGIWSANGDVGNVLGFLLGNLILNQLELRWEYVMFIGAGVHLLLSLLVFLILKDKKDENKSEQLLSEESEAAGSRVEKFKEFLSFSKDIIKSHENKMYLLSMGLLKSILYGFLLWMPTYMKHKDEIDLATYAPSLFNVATVFGSALLGYFYKEKRRVPPSEYSQMTTCQKCVLMLNKNMKSYSLFYSCLLIAGCLLFFFLEEDMSIIVTMVISAVIGFFLGGAFNMLASNEVMAITKGDDKKVDMLSTLSMASGNIIVGIVEIIIGLALNVKKDYSKEKNLFVVLLAISSAAAIIILVRSAILYKQRRAESVLIHKNETQENF